MANNDDKDSVVSWGDASETDRMMFSVLSNTERLDLSLLPSTNIQELPCIEEESPPNVDTSVGTRTQHETENDFEVEREKERELERDQERQRELERDQERQRELERDQERQREMERERVSSSNDSDHERQSLLFDLRQLEAKGVKLSRNFTLNDSIDDMTIELKRQILMLDERSNISMMKNGMRIALSGIELLNTRLNLLDLEGWSSQACTELENHDQNLAKIYRKYWRRSTSSGPEMDIVMSLVGSMGSYHMKRTMTRSMMRRSSGGNASRVSARSRPPTVPSPETSDDEEVPRAR